MNFSDYVIDKSDYEFFISLELDEKLLFIYDLICDQVYGTGSVEEFNSDTIENDVDKIESFVDKVQNKLHSIIESSINEKALVNMLIINNKIVLNSKSLNLIEDAVSELYIRGYLLSKIALTEEQSDLFHRQRYCRVYNIIGILPPITQN
jgi:hypothetical protein